MVNQEVKIWHFCLKLSTSILLAQDKKLLCVVVQQTVL